MTQAADIWTLACTLVHLFQVHDLFDYYGHRGHDNDALVAHIVSTLGTKPGDAWWKEWERRLEFFDEDGPKEEEEQKKKKHAEGSRSLLQARVDQRTGKQVDQLPEDERQSLERMLRGMLSYDPAERWTVADVVYSEWMTRYGKPAIEALESRADKGVLMDTGIVDTATEVSMRIVRLPSDASGSDDDGEVPVRGGDDEEGDEGDGDEKARREVMDQHLAALNGKFAEPEGEGRERG